MYLFLSDCEGQIVSGHERRTGDDSSWPDALRGVDVTQMLAQLLGKRKKEEEEEREEKGEKYRGREREREMREG